MEADNKGHSRAHRDNSRLFGSFEGGMEIDEIIKEYDLEREDVLAALAYPARIICRREIALMPELKFLLGADMPRQVAN